LLLLLELAGALAGAAAVGIAAFVAERHLTLALPAASAAWHPRASGHPRRLGRLVRLLGRGDYLRRRIVHLFCCVFGVCSERACGSDNQETSGGK
jgi:hypothetical protein